MPAVARQHGKSRVETTDRNLELDELNLEISLDQNAQPSSPQKDEHKEEIAKQPESEASPHRNAEKGKIAKPVIQEMQIFDTDLEKESPDQLVIQQQSSSEDYNKIANIEISQTHRESKNSDFPVQDAQCQSPESPSSPENNRLNETSDSFLQQASAETHAVNEVPPSREAYLISHVTKRRIELLSAQ